MLTNINVFIFYLQSKKIMLNLNDFMSDLLEKQDVFA